MELIFFYGDISLGGDTKSNDIKDNGNLITVMALMTVIIITMLISYY